MTAGLTGRATVTGAASGIGRAVAVHLRDAGCEVLAVDRDADLLATLDGVEPHVCDLTDDAARAALADLAAGSTYLVNAAGILLVKPILESTVEDMRRVNSVNLEATWDLMRRIGPSMPEGGAIVNLSSAAARLQGNTETALYSASKAAIISITRSFAHALAPGVRVNAVCPGMIDTPMQVGVLEGLAAVRGTTPEAVLASRLATLPLGRMASADEVADVIAFLLSPASGYLTGQALSNDGGLVML